MSSRVAPAIGAVVAGSYRVVRPLSEGGMGAVYVAEQLATGAPRALKLMRPELCAEASARRLFEQEARIGHRIPSDHVVHVIDAGVDEQSGIPWIAMELLQGEDLAARVRRLGQLSWEEAASILGQIGHAVAAAHDIGVIHRDLKPENVFLALARREGSPLLVKLLDFGVAKVVAEAALPGTLVGTPLWMAPEQISGAPVSPATDVWAFGLLAFWALTGYSYWASAGGAVRHVLAEIAGGSLVRASARAAELGRAALLPPGFDAWFARCVALEPEQRFVNARAACEVLRVVLVGAGDGSSGEDRWSSLPPADVGSGPQPPGAAYHAHWYVPREREEREVLNALAFAGKPAVLWGPSRFGKTWLLDRCLELTRERDRADTIVIDMRQLERGSLDDLLHSLAGRVVEKRDEPLEVLEEAWRRPGTAVSKITRLLERRVLPSVERALVLAIDGVDEIWQSPFQDDFCALLRSWAETCHAPWSKLRLMLAVSTSPALLISDPNRSPFNLSAPTMLSDLNAAQVQELARRYGLPWAAPEIERLMLLVGGHPYLARLIMHRAALHRTPLEDLLDPGLGTRWVLHEDVGRIRRGLTRIGLLGAAARVAADPAAALEPIELERVLRAGVVVEEAPGRLRLRNHLYEIAVAGGG